MVKKEVVICDICGNRVAKTQCNLCGSDICNFRSCIRTFPIDIGDGFKIKNKRIEILYCRDCWDKKIKNILNKKEFWDKEFLERTAKSFGDCIRKRLIIEGLEDK